MFVPIHGTSIVMLAIDGGVLVGADKRVGLTTSLAVSDDASKIIPIQPIGLVTGCGLAALRSEDDGSVHVDIMRMFRQHCRFPGFRFGLHDFERLGQCWMDLMNDHLRRCAPVNWPAPPDRDYWFRALFVSNQANAISAWSLDLTYTSVDGLPHVGAQIDTIRDEFVNRGHLLMEGDQRGGQCLENPIPDSALLEETCLAWTTGIDPVGVNVTKGIRIVKDALYANHLCSRSETGQHGVGATCDIAMIERGVGFRWIERNGTTLPPEF